MKQQEGSHSLQMYKENFVSNKRYLFVPAEELKGTHSATYQLKDTHLARYQPNDTNFAPSFYGCLRITLFPYVRVRNVLGRV